MLTVVYKFFLLLSKLLDHTWDMVAHKKPALESSADRVHLI